MQIVQANTEQGMKDWQEFVEAQAECSNYHRWGWKQVIENSFRWPTFYLMAKQNGRVSGVLPLVWQKSWLFGNFLTSLPFLNYGGVVAESLQVEEALLHEAIDLARHLRAGHLELRHRRAHRLGLPTRTNKVTVVRQLDSDTEKMWQSLPTRVRTGIRKAEKSGLTATCGGEEFLEDFYSVFAENMRALGTPVYGKNFFVEILRTFPTQSHICIVRHRSKPVAASFLNGYRDTLEDLWGCSSRQYLSMKPNMLLFWKTLSFACERGYRVVDFGRSSVGSGPHRFKMQWGSEEVPLHWDYWLRNGDHLPELNPQNPRYRLAIRMWQMLPVPFTIRIGPGIVKRLP